jgi:hypothetical protein
MDQIARVLDLMGSSPDRIAATLLGATVQRLRDNTSSMNPIVRYLNQNLDLEGRLEEGADGTMLLVFCEGGVYEVKLPDPVRTFLQRFHQGLYPDLEGAVVSAER